MNKARPFSRQYILIFTDDTIIYQTESICHEYKLEDLNKVYETINYFYFYIHRSKAIVLPQNMMTTAEKNKINYMLTDKNISIRKFNFK